MSWEIVFSTKAAKDAKRLSEIGLKDKTQTLLELMQINPFQTPPPYEKLVGDLKGLYSRRINIQHRLVYSLYPDLNIIKVLRMWSHYE